MFPVFFDAGRLAPSHHVLGVFGGASAWRTLRVQEGKGVAGKSHGGSSESETTPPRQGSQGCSGAQAQIQVEERA